MPDAQIDCNVIVSAASALPVDDRLRLIDALASSVPDDCSAPLHPLWMD